MMVSPSIATDIPNFLLFVDNPLVSLVDEDSAGNEYLAITTAVDTGVGSGTGVAVGTDVGSITGMAVGTGVGSGTGMAVGTDVGSGTGVAVGTDVGSGTGMAVGTDVGSGTGMAVGTGVGSGTGMPVGTDVGPTTMVGIERVTSALPLASKVGVGLICGGAAPEQANSPTPINTTRKVTNRMFAASIIKP
jgi:hypothetical protein